MHIILVFAALFNNTLFLISLLSSVILEINTMRGGRENLLKY